MRRLTEIHINRRFFVIGSSAILLFVASVMWPLLMYPAWVLLGLLFLATALDYRILFGKEASAPVRNCATRFSNGDANTVAINIKNPYPFKALAMVEDEPPVEFQIRDLRLTEEAESGGEKTLQYTIRPVKRGLYTFGACHVTWTSPLGLLSRTVTAEPEQAGTHQVKVYPSFHHLRTYELMAVAGPDRDAGSFQIRTEAPALEFDQIREYTQGDEVRTVNWAASARVNKLMVNQFMEERSQPVYTVLDTGRVMEMPFGGMTLLDYSINAALGLARVIMAKQDKPGLITFSDKSAPFLPASNRTGQQQKLAQMLYSLSTGFEESSFEVLYTGIRRNMSTRSTLLLFTNVESVHSLHRKMPVLRKLNTHHLLVVILFRNTGLYEIAEQPAGQESDIYEKALAEDVLLSKEEIVKTLRKAGIRTLQSSPSELSVRAINAYLELKR